MRETPKPYEVYRHFKGNCYQIMSIATHSETGEKMVVYQQLYAPFGMYVRPLEMFMSEVDRAKYPEVKQTYRFEKIEPGTAQSRQQSVAKDEPASVQKAADVSPQISCLYTKTAEKNVSQMSETESKVVSEKTSMDLSTQAEEMNIHPGLLSFLEADTYEEKLEILSQLHPVITDAMIDTMAVSLDIEIKEGDIEQRYNEIMNCLLTMERFECNRLR